MLARRILLLLTTIAATLPACITVNVYFPAAALEQAADRVVKEVYGIKTESPPASPAPARPPAAKDRSGARLAAPPAVAVALLNLLVPVVGAQVPDVDLSSPEIAGLKATLRTRHQQLLPYYNAGAIGMSANALLVLRDPRAVSLQERDSLSQLIAAENRDRNALYAGIAQANSHPEWEPEIRAIFDRRWVANAPAGWWFQSAAQVWVQK